MDFLTKGLNKEQKEAVLSENKRTLVFAGAGTGKTKVLTSRIAYLISIGVEPTSILAVTFTNKAAGEMKKRTLSMIEEMELKNPIFERDLSIGTFHGICHRMLRKHSSLAGLDDRFSVMDSDDQQKFIKEIVESKLNMFSEVKDKKERTKKIKKAVGLSLKEIGDLKDQSMRPKDVSNKNDYFKEFGFDFKSVYLRYEEEKDKMHLLDFSDLILCVVELLEENPQIQKEYNNIFRHILIDEFQDTNILQYKLITLLYNKKESYLFVVGDDDQSIYEWRGAKIENILNFDKNYKDAKIVKLEQNYRSKNNILKCANNLIKVNEKRKGKNLWSNKDDGEKVKVIGEDSSYREADRIATLIKENIRKGFKKKDIAILYRSNYISRIIESKLNENKIQYTIIGGVGFWSRLEIKDIMSYLSLIINTENDMAFERVINTPSRKIGAKKLEQIRDFSMKNNVSKMKALEALLEANLIKGEAGKNAKHFLNSIFEIKNNENIELSEKLSKIVEHFDLINYYLDKFPDEKGEEKEQNINELLNASETFINEDPNSDDDLAFLNHAILQSTADKDVDGDTVQMMTVHAAKGLEFPVVFIMAMEDGIFPSEAALKDGKIEEERRLAYVAITRAEERLYISSSKERFPNTPIPPSRFLLDLPYENIEVDRNGYKTNNNQDYYKKNEPKKDYKKSRLLDGFKLGTLYEHEKYGKGIVTGVLNKGDTYEVKINFKGLIGEKKFLIEVD